MTTHSAAHEKSLLAMKRDIIRELFVKTSEQTYVVARWCFLNSLYLDFYWNGAQALERVMKAVLLYNGGSAIKPENGGSFGHNLRSLYDAVSKNAGDLLPKTLRQPDDLDIRHWTDESATDFIGRMNNEGDPNNRYNIFGFVQRSEDIYKLDETMFALRRLCLDLDAPYPPSEMKGDQPPRTNRDILSADAGYMPGFAGSRLQKLTSGKGRAAVREAALQHNLAFPSEGFSHDPLRSSWSADNPVLGRRILEYAENANPENAALVVELTQWVLDNIKLPKGVVGQLEAARKSARGRLQAS